MRDSVSYGVSLSVLTPVLSTIDSQLRLVMYLHTTGFQTREVYFYNDRLEESEAGREKIYLN